MDAITITAEPREVGKKAAHAARRAGNVPCVLYGRHVEPVAFQIPEAALKPLVYTSELHVVRLELGGQAWDCIMKDIDFHPVTERPLHADFLALQRGEKVTMTVPLRVHGQAVGVRDGGDLQVIAHELAIRCLPKDIPAHIDVNVDALKINEAVHVRDLSIPGVEFLATPDQTVVAIAAPRTGDLDAPATPAAEAGGEAAEEAGE